jgi:hypothetical protein
VSVTTATYENPEMDSVPATAHRLVDEHEIALRLVIGEGMLSWVQVAPPFVVCSTMEAGEPPLLSPTAKHDWALGQETLVRVEVAATTVGVDQVDPVMETKAPPSPTVPTA